MFETKSGGTFEIKELGDRAGWTITGYASTFGGQPDRTGDVIAKGAFAASIAARQTKFLYQHADPIGVQISLEEDQHGLLGTWEIVPTALGTDAHMLAKAGVLDSLSIGFLTQDAEFRDDGVRVIKQVDLLEVSLVTFPANENAVITAVKNGFGLSYEEHAEKLQDALREFVGRTRSRSETWQQEVKAGAKISDARRARMSGVQDGLLSASAAVVNAADEIGALLTETAPPEKALAPLAPPPIGIDVAYELAMRRNRLRGRVEIPA